MYYPLISPIPANACILQCNGILLMPIPCLPPMTASIIFYLFPSHYPPHAWVMMGWIQTGTMPCFLACHAMAMATMLGKPWLAPASPCQPGMAWPAPGLARPCFLDQPDPWQLTQQQLQLMGLGWNGPGWVGLIGRFSSGFSMLWDLFLLPAWTEHMPWHGSCICLPVCAWLLPSFPTVASNSPLPTAAFFCLLH